MVLAAAVRKIGFDGDMIFTVLAREASLQGKVARNVTTPDLRGGRDTRKMVSCDGTCLMGTLLPVSIFRTVGWKVMYTHHQVNPASLCVCDVCDPSPHLLSLVLPQSFRWIE